METLPIDILLREIVDTLREHSGLVITAAPGAGKTTRVPRALLDQGIAGTGEIVVLQPRRLAARVAAARVASEMGEAVGRTVGYTVRFENVDSRQTRIRFITEGILSRKIVAQPNLSDISVVILDEFHERHITTDLALAYLRRLQLGSRPDLKLVVMSATLETAPIAAFLGNAQVIAADGKRFPIHIEHEPKASDVPLEEKILSSTRHLLSEGLDGDLLVFLPGAAEIRKAGAMLGPLAERTGLRVFPLHGDLAAQDQMRAVEATSHRKIILSTNVAETSITIPNIAAVIDSGLARVASHSAWSGLPLLQVARISKASAKQRTGRAGRTRDGRVFRLYTRADYESRPERDVPEIRRSDLAETLLTLHGAGVSDPETVSWFEAPPAAAMEAGEELLMRLGALEPTGQLTDLGRRMVKFPVHPRIARLILEGEMRGAGEEAATIAALLSERDIRIETRTRLSGEDLSRPTRAVGASDLLELRESFEEAALMGFEFRRMKGIGLDPGAVDRVSRGRMQLSRLLDRKQQVRSSVDQIDEALRIAILAAYPDRVAKRRSRASRELVLCRGGSAKLAQESVVHEATLMVAVDASERRHREPGRGTSEVVVRLASAIEPEWLAVLFPDEIDERTELIWNETGGRIDEARRTSYGQVLLEESLRPAKPSDAVAELLREHVLARGVSAFSDGADLQALVARLTILARCFPEGGISPPGPAEIAAVIGEACAGKRSLAEIAGVSLSEMLCRHLTKHQRDMLARNVPERIQLTPKRQVKIHYEGGHGPWIESRLQDFFGMKGSPTLCSGRLPLTIHLLAPNGRAVQVTQDLAGFWQRHYPSVRRELQRRYPRHPWPDPGLL